MALRPSSAPKLSLVPKDTASAVASLRVSEDEYSVKVSHADDRKFWLRIARDCERLPPDVARAPGDLIVTDLKRSDVPEAGVVEALMLATRAMHGPAPAPPGRIRYLDIAPVAAGDVDEAKSEAAHLARISVRFAAQLGQRIADARLVARTGKHDLECVLEPADRAASSGPSGG